MSEKNISQKNGYTRCIWWDEMRRRGNASYQLVPLTAAEDEMLHRNKLSFLLEIIAGKLPQPQPVRLQHSL
jgi:hypothetical protein